MPAIPAAVAAILGSPAPVLFLDTCVLLDVVRAPHRDSVEEIEAATELLVSVQRNPPGIHLVVACPTPTEHKDNLLDAQVDCEVAVRCVDSVALAWGFLGVPGLPLLAQQVTQLSDRLTSLSQDLLAAVMELDKDDFALRRAADRVIRAELPARKGGKGAKDAIIMEHAVELAIALRAAGFNGLCLFASSNTTDFASGKTTTLHPNLQAPFGPPASLTYAARLSLAVRALKSSGWVP
jgi:hypothetical protein